MSYNNQSFTPQSGNGNLSAQFNSPNYAPSSSGLSPSAPRDIPGRNRRQSSVSSGYPTSSAGSYAAGPPPNPQAYPYGTTPPGAYSQNPAYSTSPKQMPPIQMPMSPYGASPTSQPVYSTSPQAPLQPMVSYPGYAPAQQLIPQPLPSMRRNSDSDTSHKSRRDSYSDHGQSHSHSHSKHEKHHHKSKDSREDRVKSPRRPTLTDSLLMAVDGLKGAFDPRK